MTVKPNIYLKNTSINLPYKSAQYVASKSYYEWPNLNDHAKKLEEQLKNIKQSVAINNDRKGTYLEFSGKPGYDLAFDRLEDMRKKIRLLNVQETEVQETEKDSKKVVVSAAVFVPKGKENHFIDKVNDFKNKKTRKGKPKNGDFVKSTNKINEASVDALWTGKKEEIPVADCYCEVWLYYNENKDSKDNENIIKKTLIDFKQACKKSKIKICEKEIIFPEKIVKLVYANKDKLAKLLQYSSAIAEFRRAPIVSNFFTKLNPKDQQMWIDDLLERTEFKASGNVAVCILDTGVNYKHPLLKKAIKNSKVIQSVNQNWNSNDILGHGTQLAGIVLYDDLRKIIAESSSIVIKHNIESIKILPDENYLPKKDEPELYGNITHQAISKAELADPKVKNRIVCMAVTATDYNTDDGSPSSWSAEIDQITSGVDESDKRHLLFLVSAGNTTSEEVEKRGFDTANTLHQIENPGQSWNAITVGAYTGINDVEISSNGTQSFKPVSSANHLSPFSSTSSLWDNHWPIKPDILLDGGNMMTNGKDVDYIEDLELLTTGNNITKPLTTLSGTSSAVAQASNIAAILSAEYPEYWPETIRALLVHSAEWKPEMLKKYCPDDKKKNIRTLLRTCGYGIPNLNKAEFSADNSVNLIIQDEIQPFGKDGMHEMKLHELPWPTENLKSLGNTDAKLKITLSYFIEPGPGQVGWKNKYRYPSANLKFDVNGMNETEKEFESRINKAMRDSKYENSKKKRDWYIGSDNRDVGSIHSDFIETSAINLSDATKVAVFPTGGWWKDRKSLGKVESKMRYSLIVSIETPSSEGKLYNEIKTKITPTIEVQI